jgi:hypothetical protein
MRILDGVFRIEQWMRARIVAQKRQRIVGRRSLPSWRLVNRGTRGQRNDRDRGHDQKMAAKRHGAPPSAQDGNRPFVAPGRERATTTTRSTR